MNPVRVISDEEWRSRLLKAVRFYAEEAVRLEAAAAVAQHQADLALDAVQAFDRLHP